MRTIFSCLLLVTVFAAGAQNSIRGTVIDSLTREPISFANVYFAGTTTGTTSREDGTFELKGFASGMYDLAASFVGYHPAQRSFTFDNSQLQVTLVLLEKATQLAEVVVRPDNSARPYNLITFRENFLGSTKNSLQTKIGNEKDLDFDYDMSTQVFTTFSRKPLDITNEALGYRITYDLQVFELDHKTRTMVYLGIPRFENLSDKIKNRWDRERRRAYRGSMLQFIRLLKSGGMDEHFDVYYFYRFPNPKRPTREVLNARIKYWSENQLSSHGFIAATEKTEASDSLNYYLKLKKLPETVDSIGLKVADVAQLLDQQRNTLTYTGLLYVICKAEPEEEAYAAKERRMAQRQQTSIIHILNPVTIYDNGYYDHPRSIYLEGYMGWSEKLSELLPFDYREENN